MDIKLDPDLTVIVEQAKSANPNPPHPADIPLEVLRAGYVMQGQLQATQGLHCETVYDTAIESEPGDAAPVALL